MALDVEDVREAHDRRPHHEQEARLRGPFAAAWRAGRKALMVDSQGGGDLGEAGIGRLLDAGEERQIGGIGIPDAGDPQPRWWSHRGSIGRAAPGRPVRPGWA